MESLQKAVHWIHWKSPTMRDMYVSVRNAKPFSWDLPKKKKGTSNETHDNLIREQWSDIVEHNESIPQSVINDAIQHSCQTIHVVHTSIYPDDTIQMARYKISNILADSPEQIYLWRRAETIPSAINIFDSVLQRVFRQRSDVLKNEALRHLYRVSNIDLRNIWNETVHWDTVVETLRTALEQGVSIVHESAEFHYLSPSLSPKAIYINPFDVRVDEMFDPDWVDETGISRSDARVVLQSQSWVGGDGYSLHVATTKDVKLFMEHEYAEHHPKLSTKLRDAYILHGILKKYFPLVQGDGSQKLFKQIAPIVDHIDAVYQPISSTIKELNALSEKQKANKDDGIVQTLHFHVHSRRTEKRILPLHTLFRALHTTDTAPFFEFNTYDNNLYKVYKPSISFGVARYIPEETLRQWTTNGSVKRKQTYLRIRLYFGRVDGLDLYFQLTIHEDGTYDCKYVFPEHNKPSWSQVIHSFQSVDEFLDEVRGLLMLSPSYFYRLTENTDAFHSSIPSWIQVYQCIVQKEMRLLKSVIAVKSLTKWLENAVGFFDIPPNSGGKTKKDATYKHAVYKRVPNYYSDDAIDLFIKQNLELGADKLSNLVLSRYPNMQKDEVDQIITDKMAAFNGEKAPNRRLFVPRFDKGIRIRLLIRNGLSMSVQMEGDLSDLLTRHIENVLLKGVSQLAGFTTKRVSAEAMDEIVVMQKEKEKLLDVILADASSSDDGVFGDSDSDAASSGTRVSFGSVGDGDDSESVGDDNGKEDGKTESGSEEEYEGERKREVVKKAPQEENIEKYDFQEVMTNKDARSRYDRIILTQLIQRDQRLFNFSIKTEKGPSRYSSICQAAQKRQPVGVSREEIEYIEKNYPGSFEGFIKEGSTDEMTEKNFYICPKIWCPFSRVSLTDEQYEAAGSKCPGDIGEPAIIMDTKFWRDSEGKQLSRYPGLHMKLKTPDGNGIPCCFKVPQKGVTHMESVAANKKQTNHKSTQHVEPILEDRDRYIMNMTGMAMPPDRYGTLPHKIATFFHSDKCTGTIKDNQVCFVRKGILQNADNFLYCLAYTLGYEDDIFHNTTELIDHIEKNMTAEDFITFNNGQAVKAFYDPSRTIKNEYKAFRTWFRHKRNRAYVKSFQLDDLVDMPSKLAPSPALEREYIIFNAYTNFIDYLKSPVPKSHYILQDIMGFQWLNPQRIQLVVLEQVGTLNSARMVVYCPRYLGTKYQLSTLYPVTYVMKMGRFYEPIMRIHYTDRVVRERLTFSPVKYDPLSPQHHIIIQSLRKQCMSPLDEPTKVARRVYRDLVTSGTVQELLTNLSFKLMGFRLKDAKRKYVFLKDPAPLTALTVSNIPFRYIHDIEFTKKPRTNVMDGCISAEEALRYSRYNLGLFLRGTEDNSLDNHDDILYHVLRRVLSHGGEVAALHRLQHPLNPLPVSQKRKRVEAIMVSVLGSEEWDQLDLEVRERIIHECTWKPLKYLVESALRNSLPLESEAVFDQTDVRTQKVQELYESLQNPYLKVNTYEDYIQWEHVYHQDGEKARVNLKNKHSIPLVRLTKIRPETWNAMMPGFFVQEDPLKELGITQNQYLKDVLTTSAKIARSLTRSMESQPNQFRDIVRSIAALHWENEPEKTLAELRSGTSFATMADAWKKMKKGKALELKDVQDIMASDNYQDSIYELRWWAILLGLNIVLIGRKHEKTRKLPGGIRVFTASNPAKAPYVVLHVGFTDSTREVYRLIVSGNEPSRPVYLFTDFTQELQQAIIASIEDGKAAKESSG